MCHVLQLFLVWRPWLHFFDSVIMTKLNPTHIETSDDERSQDPYAYGHFKKNSEKFKMSDFNFFTPQQMTKWTTTFSSKCLDQVNHSTRKTVIATILMQRE